jgi:hypothetical protein
MRRRQDRRGFIGLPTSRRKRRRETVPECSRSGLTRSGRSDCYVLPPTVYVRGLAIT